MADTHHATELHVLNWHSFHNETEGGEFVLYITGATPEEAYANAVRHVRGLQQGGPAPSTAAGS